jgi:hypothetical protein
VQLQSRDNRHSALALPLLFIDSVHSFTQSFNLRNTCASQTESLPVSVHGVAFFGDQICLNTTHWISFTSSFTSPHAQLFRD